MNQQHYFTDETLIAESDNKQVILTTHRIRHQSSSQVNVTSFMLEKVSSIQTTYQSAVVLLILGILFCVAGPAAGSDPKLKELLPAGLLIGGLLIVIFLVSRKHTVVITAECGTKITFEIKGDKREIMDDFINKIEKAKNDRYLKVHREIVS